MSSHPPVSVILAVYNEAAAIDECLAGLHAQDYQGGLEIVVADGGSRDGTGEKLADWKSRLGERIVVVPNPERNQAAGLNRAAAAASGEILVRADGHTTYERDYVRRSVEALTSTGATAVGGRQVPRSERAFGRAVVDAMASRLAVGTARYRHATRPSDADTVYLGAYRKADFEAVGGYRYLPSGVAEDADFYFRLRRRGGRVLLDPSIRSWYRPREHVGALARQYYRYGKGKADLLYLNGRFPSWRPLAPLALVGSLAVAGLLAAAGRRALLGAVLTGWGGALGSVAAGAGGPPPHRARVALAAATMHITFGSGLAIGLVQGPSATRSLREAGTSGP